MQKEGGSLRAKIAAGLACLALALAAALLPVRRAEGEAETPGREGYYGADADISFAALSGGELVQTTMAEWLPGVVAAEMPASFEDEALRAQAVAARTYILHLMGSGKAAHPEAAVCDDPACCKAHLDRESLRGSWGGSFDSNYEKVFEAASSTDGQYLAWEGEAIEAVFHSSSAGMTEDAAEVWSARPYLVSVSSPETAGDVPDYVTSVEVSPEDFAAKLTALRPGADLSGRPAGWLGPLERDGSGRVEGVEIGGESFTGQELREAFSLRSTAFTLDCTGEAFLFTVTGYGHGVGMSQYGANVMAEGGADYREILAHYYPGTELVGA